MGYYRKKPVIVEAWEYTGQANTIDEVWVARAFNSGELENVLINGRWHLKIRTLEDGPNGEAKHIANPGDFIIRGVQGELYPCKPDIFWETYEYVSRSTN